MTSIMRTHIYASTAHHTFFTVSKFGIFHINGSGWTLCDTSAAIGAFISIDFGEQWHFGNLFIWPVPFYGIQVKQATVGNSMIYHLGKSIKFFLVTSIRTFCRHTWENAVLCNKRSRRNYLKTTCRHNIAKFQQCVIIVTVAIDNDYNCLLAIPSDRA